MFQIRRWVLLVGVAAVLAPTSAVPAGASPVVTSAPLAPVVLFPAFHFSKLLVRVDHQRVDSSCPSSGTFEDWYRNPARSAFSQVCRDELLTLRYDARAAVPMAGRFAEQRGVRISFVDYGAPSSAPFYEPMYRALTSAGLVRRRTIRVADYDSRLTPDMGGFLPRTKKLIEETYRAAGGRPVHLVGHSNGPLYAQYLLTHTTAAWKARYIHGFTPIAGNFPGQGVLYPVLFTGLNTVDFSFPVTRANALSSARMYLASPSSYMSAAAPTTFGRTEVVVRDDRTGRRYTPADYPRLLTDAGLPRALSIARHYVGFVRFAPAGWFPDVDVYAERGSGIPTVVGLSLRGLRVGQLLSAGTAIFQRDGDVNQEDTTNVAIAVWRAMSCYRFALTDNSGVDHFSLPSNRHVLARLIADLARVRSHCQ